ncbi:carboxypeptidase-like regulatory domain-containing protein [Flagellimonas flava]|uniref:CarboxypepD_reg-like domain-containing protein n=1 Tax=Flagellimonas flava TaxID=570519 RepID=A0A1M5ITW6_9FLAO|nr:carboxypeptidase-like regulatory domain-containing protein [Allomuricauda flava]SHG31788.1 CarboxypepD_reg-like domain-containing protein [Allomuricauda flava]
MKILTYFLAAILGLVSLSTVAQTRLSGHIVDLDSRQPVDFANIGVLDKNVGTVSDFDGSFKLDLEASDINSTDTLQISRIGYRTIKFSTKDFLEQLQSNPVVELEATAYELDGIVVKSSDSDKRRMGYQSRSKRLFGFWNDSLALGGEHASKIMVRRGPVKLEDLSFHVAANISDSILVRVNVYELERGLPGKNFTTANILHTIKQRQGTITIDLSPYNIVVDDHFVISLELLKIYGGRVGIGISAFDDGARSYTRVVSQGRWKRMRKGFTIAYHLNTSSVDKEDMVAGKDGIPKRDRPDIVSILWDTSRSMEQRDLERELAFLDAYFKEIGSVTVALRKFSNNWSRSRLFKINNGYWLELKKVLESTRYDGGASQRLWDSMEVSGHALLFTDGKNYPEDLGKEWSTELFTINGDPSANHKFLKELAEDHGGNYLNLEKMVDLSKALQFTKFHIKDNLEYGTRLDVKKASTVRGSVGDLDSPLTKVLVKVRNSDRETRTDTKGNFSIQAFDGEILDFSYPGREDASSVVNTGSQMLKIIMPIGITALEEVVLEENRKLEELHRPLNKDINTRFGKLDMNKVGFSVKQMEGSEISPSAQTLMDAVEGKFPGVKTVRVYPEDYEVVQLRDRALAWDIDGHIYPPQTPPFHINVHNIKDLTIMPPSWSVAKYGRLAPGGIIIVRTISNTFDDIELVDKTITKPGNIYLNDAVELASGLPSKPIYVQRIANRSSAKEGYLQYLKEQEHYGSYPSFYQESSEIFLRFWKEVSLSNLVKSNLLESFSENTDALKILAYSYEQQGDNKEAQLVYEHIHGISPSLQAKRDLARMLTKLGSYKEAWSVYKGYVSNRDYLEEEGLDKLARREILDFVQNHGDKVGLDPSKFNFEETGDLSLIVEWNDPNTQFELQFVGPNQRFFNWNNTVEVSQEQTLEGNLSAIFDIDESQQGDWLVNMTYMGNQANLPTYLKFTLRNNATGEEEMKMVTLRQQNVKYKVMNIGSKGMMLY